MNNGIKIGMIGTGHGLRTLLPGFEHSKQAEIIAVSGSSHQRAKEFAAEHKIPIAARTYQEILAMDDLDLICIASPNEFHFQQIVAALNTNKNLYVEKPQGINSREAAEIVNTEAKAASNRLVILGHQLRFNPYLKKIRSTIASGNIGRIYSIQIHQRGGAFSDHERPWTWEFEDKKGGGVRLAMGSHLLDLLVFLLNRTPLSTYGYCDPVHLKRYPDSEEAREVVASNFYAADFDFGDCIGSISTSAASHGPGQFNVEILGSHGAITYDGTTNLHMYKGGSQIDVSGPQIDDKDYLNRPGSSIFRKSFTYLAQEIVSAVINKETQIEGACSLADGQENLNWLDNSLAGYLNRFDVGRKGF